VKPDPSFALHDNAARLAILPLSYCPRKSCVDRICPAQERFTARSNVDDREQNRPPMALAMEWVSKITTVALEMVLPGIFGQWLDGKWGTGFLGLAGFALGVTVGLWHLLRMTKSTTRQVDKSRQAKSPSNGGEPPAARDSKSL
jgi:ATP synthase protein I